MKNKENYILGALMAVIVYFLFVHKKKQKVLMETKLVTGGIGDIEAQKFDEPITPVIPMDLTNRAVLNYDLLPHNMIPDTYDPSNPKKILPQVSETIIPSELEEIRARDDEYVWRNGLNF